MINNDQEYTLGGDCKIYDWTDCDLFHNIYQ